MHFYGQTLKVVSLQYVKLLGAIAILILLLAACNHEPNVSEFEHPDGGGEKVYLLTQSDGANLDDAGLGGELRLVDGCLRVGWDPVVGGRLAPTVIWPEGFDVAFDGPAVLILDEHHRVATRVGELTLLGGSEGASDPERIGECEGPFWYAGPSILTGDDVPGSYR